MGRKAKLKAARRERRRLEERLQQEHPYRQCCRVSDDGGSRCDEFGWWEIETEPGQPTIDPHTGRHALTPGKVYACDAHAVGFRLIGNRMKRLIEKR